MECSLLIAYPMPPRQATAEKWTLWRRAFEICLEKNLGAIKFGPTPVAVDVTFYGDGPVPAWSLKKIIENLVSLGIISSAGNVRSICLRMEKSTKGPTGRQRGMAPGNMKLKITKVRR